MSCHNCYLLKLDLIRLEGDHRIAKDKIKRLENRLKDSESHWEESK